MAKNREGSFRIIAVFFFLTMIIAFNWEKWDWLRNAIHVALDPSIGALLDWNLTIGMIIVIFLISVITVVLQKYTTNQEELKKIKKIQKELQKKSNENKHDPKKSMEIQKEMMDLMPKQMKLGMRTIVYTGIPFVLLFKWFYDYFATLEAATGAPVRFFGFLGWFWFYLIFTMIFSSILKKKFDVV
jgi:uncharacterized membrane protein (DUF106 family)